MLDAACKLMSTTHVGRVCHSSMQLKCHMYAAHNTLISFPRFCFSCKFLLTGSAIRVQLQIGGAVSA